MGLDRRAAVVTGASGFIGRHLVEELLHRERPTIAITRRRARIEAHHPLLEVREGSFSDTTLLTDVFSPGTTVFHLAASRGLPRRDASSFQSVNVDQTLLLARHCCGRVRRFVNVSTAMIFGSTPGRRADETVIHPHEGNAYFESRVKACVALESLVEEGLPLVSVFPGIVYGPDEPSHPNRITSHLRGLLRMPVRFLIGSGDTRKTLVDVGDVVQGIMLAEASSAVGERFILGGEDASQNELDALALRIAQRPPPLTIAVPGTVARLAGSLVDNLSGFSPGSGTRARIVALLSEWCFSSDRAADRLGFRPRSLEEGVGRTIDAIRQGSG